MAMTTETKLYVALGVLGVLGGGLYLQNKKEAESAAKYTLSGQAAALPKIDIKDEDIKAIDKIVLNKAGEDGGAPVDIELTKSGEDWKLTKPVEAKANQANVKSLLDNLKTLKVSEQIDVGAANYAKYGVSDDKGLHAVFSKGNGVVLDARFGENGGRGQMTRIVGKEGVFAVKPGSKLVNPAWTNPRTGEQFKADDPKNPLGEYWVGLIGASDNIRGLETYGIHGTIEPDSIGLEKSMGCVRMLDDDIRIVYEVLMEQVSRVEIHGTDWP